MSVRVSPRILHGLLLAALMPLQAEEPFFTKDLKVRGGYAMSTKDNLNNGSQGFGLNLGFGTAIGRVGVELGYFHQGGTQYQNPVMGAIPTGLSPMADKDHVGDSRRNELAGFSVRLSLQRPLHADLAWQAGLMLGGTTFRHEYVGDVQSADWAAHNDASWRDFYSGTPTEGGLKVSPFAGVAYRISSRSSLEFNALLVSYTSLDYIHRPGSGAYEFPGHGETGRLCVNAFPKDALEKKTRVQPTLEFAYVFHF